MFVYSQCFNFTLKFVFLNVNLDMQNEKKKNLCVVLFFNVVLKRCRIKPSVRVHCLILHSHEFYVTAEVTLVNQQMDL